MPNFKTIRQVAGTGLLAEYRLRLLQKQGRLPGIYVGTRFLVNVDALCRQLEQESLAAGVGDAIVVREEGFKMGEKNKTTPCLL